jgi:flagellar hook-associated protein 2
VGTPGQAGYGISLSSKAQGSPPPLDLQKTTAISYQNVGAPQNSGKLASYSIDGGPTVTSNSRSATVSNGVTLNLEGTGTTDVTVTRSTAALGTALSSFADAYNAVVDELAKQRGQSAGPLQGQSILTILSQALSNISTYNNPGGQINGLASLGLTFDQSNNGHLDYNALTLMGADLSNSASVTSFLGSASGGGFLKAATDALNGLEDPTAGLLKTSESDLTTQITNIGNQITTKQNQVAQLQTTLTNQMAAADALIASMEQQYSYLTSMFQAQQVADQMYK